MNKMFAIGFDTETAAAQGVGALHDLHGEGAKTAQRKAELEAGYEVHTDKLNRAWELTKEALE